ncbi:MAG: gamma carbonic anhydrase family protein [Clostridiales bacterium]|nr:gamma carbonic anhydrase family protein [Clostridiales bacterium]
MGIYEFKGKSPHIDDSCFIAPSADIIGDVTIGAGSSVWFNVTIRGDMAPITIGENVSIQDNSMVHVDIGIPTVIGNHVTVGHAAIIHAAVIEDNCLIGMGAVLLDEARIGQGSLVGAGALVPPRKNIPPRSQVMGRPCVITKQLDEQAEQAFIAGALRYARTGGEYLCGRNCQMENNK